MNSNQKTIPKESKLEIRDNIYNTDLLNIKYSEKRNEDSKKSLLI